MKTFTNSFCIVLFAFCIFQVCEAQIPFQGLAVDHEGTAVWNADGSGPEPAAYGHPHPFGWGSSRYYGASRDYIDPYPDAAFCHFLDGISGFPLFVQALADNGFTPGQVKIKAGRTHEGNDTEGEDWFTFNNSHYLNRYDGFFRIEVNGESMVWCQTNYLFCSNDSGSPSFPFQSNFTYPEDISAFSSPQVQAVAAAFMADMDGQQLRCVVNDQQSVSTFPPENGRVDGVYFDIVSGYLEKGQPELPFTGPAYANEGLAGWNADGSGPEPAAEGHSFYYGGEWWWMAYYTASRDYDGIDPDPGAALCHIIGEGQGFDNLAIQMAYREYTMDQLKFKAGLATLGNDIEGVDWWLDGSMHYYRHYGNKVTLEIAGEPILEYTIDTNFSSWDLDFPNGNWLSIASCSPVRDISANASPDAQFVALSLLKDIGGQCIATEMQGHGLSVFNGNGRDGVFHLVENGFVTLGQGQGTFIEEGTVSGTWPAENSPYLINGNIIVPDGQTLTIEPGVIVAFRGPYNIRIEGCVIAEGTAEENILFTHSNPTVWWDGFDYQDTPSTNDSSRFSHCTFQYGYAQGAEPFNSGGAMALTNFSKLKITNCIFQYNKADQYDITYYPTAGAIALWNSSPLIQNCIFRNNYAEVFGGAIFSYEYSKPIISGCLFYENESGLDAGAVGFDHNGDGILINNTMVDNTAENGGAIGFYENANAEIINTILWGNTASSSGNEVWIYDATCNPGYYYCDIKGGKPEFGGVTFTGDYLFNIEDDPLFTDNPAEPVYYLTIESPCINEGTPDTSNWFYPEYLLDVCLCGDLRILNERIEIGAYEVLIGGIEEEQLKMGQLTVQPNPIKNSAHIIFELKENEQVTLEVYNAVGARLAILKQGLYGKGNYNITWDAREFINGLYFIRLQTGSKVLTRKVIKMN